MNSVKTDRVREDNNGRDKPEVSRFWGSVWRGALGGLLGVFVFFAYAIYENPYAIMNLVSFFPFLLVAIISGAVSGAAIGLIKTHLPRRGFDRLVHMLVGIVVATIIMTAYFYLAEGIDDDLKGFIQHCLVFGLAVGGLAGTIA